MRSILSLSYDPQRSSAKNVAHLLAADNKFLAPTTFPTVHTCEAYAEEHGSKNVGGLSLLTTHVSVKN